jgi:hypothetical protein
MLQHPAHEIGEEFLVMCRRCVIGAASETMFDKLLDDIVGSIAGDL